MKYLIKNILTKSAWLAALLLTVAASSCNDDIDNPLQEKYPEPGTEITPSTKVLIVMLDGTSGSAVNEARNNGSAPNIKKMLWNSVYTFSGLADNVASAAVTRERGWANIMTGVTSHGVYDQNTLAASETLSVAVLAKNKKTAIYANDQSFADAYAVGNAEKHVGTGIDVFNMFVNSFENGEKADLNVIQYSGIYEAGEQDGYTDESGLHPSQAVLSEISKADALIGKVKETINERRNTWKEDWLLIVSSTNGGVLDNDGGNVYDMKDRNTFVMIYHPKFTSQMQMRPGDEELSYSYFIPVFTDKKAEPTFATVKDNSLFDIVFDKDSLKTNPDYNPSYTIQFLYKQETTNKNRESQANLVSKALRNTPKKDEGWAVINDYFRSKFVACNQTCWAQKNVAKLHDSEWHTVTVVVNGPEGLVYQYMDGELSCNSYKPTSISSSWKPVDAPLTVGRFEGAGGKEAREFFITNIQFYDVALPADYIAANYTKIAFDKNPDGFKYWDNLIGYWPMDREEDFESNIIPDYSKNGSVFGGVNAGKSDMVLSGCQRWFSAKENSSNVMPTPDVTFYQKVFNSVDIPYQALQWLNVPIQIEWKWEGIGRSLPFSNTQSEK